MTTLGQELKAERERKAVSIKDISDRTKIGTRILIALENDHWDQMPQKFFLKGVIKTYAEAIGSDPAVHLAKYEEQLATRSEAAEKDRVARGWKKAEPWENSALDSDKAPLWHVLVKIFLVFAVLALIATVVFLILKPGKKSVASVPSTEAAKTSSVVSAQAPVVPQEQEPMPVETGLRLEFRFQADCW
ncbi:MAG: helix-turn-helix domain-containing protein, partial [Candidatus Aminicenantales bacterium]